MYSGELSSKEVIYKSDIHKGDYVVIPKIGSRLNHFVFKNFNVEEIRYYQISEEDIGSSGRTLPQIHKHVKKGLAIITFKKEEIPDEYSVPANFTLKEELREKDSQNSIDSLYKEVNKQYKRACKPILNTKKRKKTTKNKPKKDKKPI